jgi:hypothetical protein
LTLHDVQKAALALFAARSAGREGNLDQMRAICYCIRSRVWAGWHDGNWLTVIEHAEDVAGNEPCERVLIDPNKRSFQRLVSEIDDIYFTRRVNAAPTYESKTAQNLPAGTELSDALEKCCYWMFLGQQIKPWFRANILNHPDEHRCRSQMGLMMFYE